MKIRVLQLSAVALLTLSTLSVMAESTLGYGIIRPRSMTDSVRGPTLTTPYESPTTAQLQGSGGGLGGRIGRFEVPPHASGYVRSTNCFLSRTASTNDRRRQSVVPVAGPYGDGTYAWYISAEGVGEDTTGMTCYFKGTGIFDAPVFDNTDNNLTTNVSGLIAAPPVMYRQVTYQTLDPVQGYYSAPRYYNVDVQPYDVCTFDYAAPGCPGWVDPNPPPPVCDWSCQPDNGR
jgi:hypothetical protein